MANLKNNHTDAGVSSLLQSAHSHSWRIDADTSTSSQVWADSWHKGGFTATISGFDGDLKVVISSRVNPDHTIDVLGSELCEIGLPANTPWLSPSISDCGQYLYVAIGETQVQVQVKIEADGLVVDVIGADGECFDTGTVFYADINPDDDA